MGLKNLQIVEVLPLKRFPLEQNSTFFYFILDDSLLVEEGDLVEVPLRKKNVFGIVVRSKKTFFGCPFPKSDSLMLDLRKFKDLANFFYSPIPFRSIKIRSIKAIKEKNFISLELLENLRLIAEKHFVSWNHLALSTLNLPAKRRGSNFYIFSSLGDWFRLAKKSFSFKKNFLKAKFKENRKNSENYIFANHGQTGELAVLIKYFLEQKKQILVLAPNKLSLFSLLGKYSFLSDSFASQTPILLSSIMPSSWFKTAWQLTKKLDAAIFLATRAGIFAPFRNLGLIIIEDGHSDSYKQRDLNPRYDVRRILPELYPKIPKIYLSNAPRLEDFYSAPRVIINKNRELSIKSYDLKKKNSPPKPLPIKPGELPYRKTLRFKYQDREKVISLVFPSVEKRLSGGDSFLGKAFNKKISQNKLKNKLSVVIGNRFNLPKVAEELVANKIFKQKDIIFSPEKNDYQSIKNFSDGLVKEFGANKILLVNSDFSLPLMLFQSSRINVFLPDFDNLAFALNFRSGEKTVARIFSFLAFAEEINIQTREPLNPIFDLIKQGFYLKFFPEWLAYRKKFNYPPFAQLFKLIAVRKNPTEAKREANKLADELSRWSEVKDVIVSSEAERARKRGIYWSVIVRADKQFDFSKLKKILPPGFFFDLDPESLN